LAPEHWPPATSKNTDSFSSVTVLLLLLLFAMQLPMSTLNLKIVAATK
jgi:hypothetical protein